MKRVLVSICALLISSALIFAQSSATESSTTDSKENTESTTTDSKDVSDSENSTDENKVNEKNSEDENKTDDDSELEEDDNEEENSSEEYQYEAPKMNQKGDQYIRISLMGSLPINFGGMFNDDSQLQTGGMGTLGYHRFLNSYLAWGIDLGFGYQPTIGSNIFNYIPLMGTFTFQPTIGKMEFPFTVGVGGAVENYLSETYFPGLVVKCDAGMFWRLNPSWSLGAEGSWMCMPQWYSDPKYNYVGYFAEIAISARYHF
ncbi:MAG: hypothetical protein K6F69_04370 [Treponema sp.]|nr:hypothetical protein [Treponema sp.]